MVKVQYLINARNVYKVNKINETATDDKKLHVQRKVLILQTTKYNSHASKMKWSISLTIDRIDVGTTVFNEILCDSQMALPVVT